MTEDEIEKSARNHAIRMVKYCLTETNFLFEKLCYYPDIPDSIDVQLKDCCITALGLKSLSDNNYDEAVDILTRGLTLTFLWMMTGSAKSYKDIGELACSYTRSAYLNIFAKTHPDDSSIGEFLPTAYYLLCLDELIGYEESVTTAVIEKADFENIELRAQSYKKSLIAINSLLGAQHAFERAQSSIWDLAMHKNKQNMRKEFDKAIEDTKLIGSKKQEELISQLIRNKEGLSKGEEVISHGSLSNQ